MITELLKQKGLKITKQRLMVLESIVDLKDNATMSNIVKKIVGVVDKSTTYRIVDMLVANEILNKNINYSNEIFYSIKEVHGHYFICIKCHKIEKLNNCPILEVEHDLEKTKGYKILNHTVQLEGICKNCQSI